MFSVHKHQLPSESLLMRYCPGHRSSYKTGYCDCYTVTVGGIVEFEEYICQFYSTSIFKAERWILGFFANLPSNDHELKLLAAGTSNRFAAWSVEQRLPDQLLLCDASGRTRSWLMCTNVKENNINQTRLLFGSAILPVTDPHTRIRIYQILYITLLGFHKFYSRVLLSSARNKILRSRRRTDH